ncbi:monothiol glutaredoxin grx4, partial [Ascosphaera acerosa]
MSAASLTEITSEAAFAAHVAALPPTTLLVLSFHAPWAAPCAQMRAVLAALAPTYAAATASFVAVDAEELPEISERYGVTAVPFLVLVRGGQVVGSVSGSDVVKVRAEIERFAGVGDAAATTTTTTTTAAATTTTATTVAPTTGTAGTIGTITTAAPEATTDTPPSKEELFARLAQLVKAAPVMLFMKGTPSAPQCGFSRQMVALLRDNQVRYGFFNILADEDVRQGLKEFADWPTFPQL